MELNNITIIIADLNNNNMISYNAGTINRRKILNIFKTC